MAQLDIDLQGVEENTAAVAALLAAHDLALVGVTKGAAGHPAVGAAMIRGGATALADTHDAHLRRLREALPGAELHRLYLPPASGAFEPGDVSYVTTPEAVLRVAALGSADSPRPLMIQVETGDLREGVPVEDLADLVGLIAAERRVRLAGLSTNYACFAGDAAGVGDSLARLTEAVESVRAMGVDIERVSGGNSSLLSPLEAGRRLPPMITELRCGEALLLGTEALHGRPLRGCRQNTVVLRAEVVEGYTKSGPRGAAGPAGESTRLVLAIGHQDVGAGRIMFREGAFRELGRSSDYLVVGVDAPTAPDIGDVVEMIPDYVAMTAACTSPFVEVRVV